MDMVTERTERTNRLIADLRSSVEAGLVWNADFEEVKSAANREAERAWDSGPKQVLLSYEEHESWGVARAKSYEYPGVTRLYYSAPSGVYAIPALTKRLNGNRKELPANVIESVEAYLRVWGPVYELFERAKPLIKKGRKPSESVNSEDRRTLENTGTCAVCEGNFKRDLRGGLVAHGYEVEFHRFIGGCPGVGFEPWEVSPKGAEKYLELFLKTALERSENILANRKANGFEKIYVEWRKRWLTKEDGSLFTDACANEIYRLEREVSGLKREVERVEAKLAAWEPGVLPGIKAGFAK